MSQYNPVTSTVTYFVVAAGDVGGGRADVQANHLVLCRASHPVVLAPIVQLHTAQIGVDPAARHELIVAMHGPEPVWQRVNARQKKGVDGTLPLLTVSR